MKNSVRLIGLALALLLTTEAVSKDIFQKQGAERMNMINVARMSRGKEKEIVGDIRKMYESGVIHSTLFIFSLVPEGNPAVDKASELAETFQQYRKEFGDCKIPVGILLQSTIGHGWKPNDEAQFTRLQLFDGFKPYMFCPMDENFRKHIVDQAKILGKLKADFFMVDDDMRMYTGRRDGCFCPLHLKEFNRRNNSDFTAEELHAAMEKDLSLAQKWDALQLEILVKFNTEIRQAMAAENPEIPGMFCTCAGDVRHAAKIAEALAAPGQKPVVRINNARYKNDSPNTWPKWTQKTAYQIAALPPDFTILAETDTFPHNRYSTSGTILHSQYAWSLLAGCRGGKLWITGVEGPEIGSGPFYRNMLSANEGFYQEIAAMKPEYSGFIEPLPQNVPFNLIKYTNGVQTTSWGTNVFSFYGFPFSFEKGPVPGRIAAFAGETEFFSDEELKQYFAGEVLLDGAAAIALTKRGFGKYMGLNASEWDAPKATFEVFKDGKYPGFNVAAALKEISPKAEIISDFYHAVTEESPMKKLTPGMVKFKNELGGTVITCAAILQEFSINSFQILRDNRKRLFAQILAPAISYPGDAPIHLTVFKDRGTLTLAVNNLCLDLMYELPLNGLPETIRRAEVLQPDGTWKSVPLENNSIQTLLPPMRLTFIRLK